MLPKFSAMPQIKERAKQFSEDLYADGVLFCHFCGHSVNYTRMDTVKDQVKSKKHLTNKRPREIKRDVAGTGSSSSRQPWDISSSCINCFILFAL